MRLTGTGRGAVAAIALIGAVNFVRVISLAYFAQFDSLAFERAHEHIWPTAIVVICAASFAAWIHASARRTA